VSRADRSGWAAVRTGGPSPQACRQRERGSAIAVLPQFQYSARPLFEGFVRAFQRAESPCRTPLKPRDGRLHIREEDT